MMPQREASELLDEQASSSSYRGYEGHPGHDERGDEAFSAQAWRGESSGKVYASPRDNKNLFRLLLAVFAMLMLLAFAFLFIVFVGGGAGIAGFGIASLAIFIIAVVGIDKIK